jgi:thiol-disulfide isomerase/thioredoxin
MLVQDDPGCQNLSQSGDKVYHWRDSRIEELKAEKEQRMEATRANQVNLQFLKGSDGRDGLFSKDGAEVKVDDLVALGKDAVVGLYFSAHWCPPCRVFTPLLAKCYTELKEAGKKFEVVFVSSDRDEESFKEYMSEMPWVVLPFSEKNLKEDLSGIFEVGGIPTIVLLKPDGTLLPANGREAVTYGSEFFPWGPEEMKRGKKRSEEEAARKRQAMLEAEAESRATQESRGGPILQRLIGAPSSLNHDVGAFTVAFQGFSTAGAPASIAKEGVLYYELEVCKTDGIPQVGFATAEFNKTFSNEQSGDGVGDDTESWGVDGTRKLWWHDGSGEWACSWTQGDTIGLAANIELGKIAVSKNGNWMEAPCGVVFHDEKIKAGVYPCFTGGGGGYTMRYNLDGKVHGPFKYAPPLMELWEKSSS